MICFLCGVYFGTRPQTAFYTGTPKDFKSVVAGKTGCGQVD